MLINLLSSIYHLQIVFAGKIHQVTNSLSMTQENLANAMGIRRSTLVKIKQDPTKFTKVMNFALYVVVSSKIQLFKEQVKNLKIEDYGQINVLPKFILDLQVPSFLNGIASTNFRL